MQRRLLTLLPIALLLACTPVLASPYTYTFTFNNEGTIPNPNPPPANIDRPIQAANWNGIYSSAALPAVTGTAIFADLSEGVIAGQGGFPGAYKAGFLFVSGKDSQPAPGGFLVWSANTNVVYEPQLPQGGSTVVNPQTDWFSPDAGAPGNLNQLLAGNLLTLQMYVSTRNAAGVRYHFALKIDGEWYVSQQVFQGSGNNVWTLASIDIQSANWLGGITGAGFLNLDFTANPPTVHTIASLGPTAMLDTIGVYIDTDNAAGTTASWARVDSIILTAVPEPAAYAAVLAGLALLFVALRRRARG